MNMLRMHRVRLAAFVLATGTAMLGSAAYLKAQTEIAPVGCELRTRWKDAFGDCPSCCDARDYACPCTV